MCWERVASHQVFDRLWTPKGSVRLPPLGVATDQVPAGRHLRRITLVNYRENLSDLGISYLPQEASIFRNLSVKDNILAILETRKNLTPKKLNDKLEFLVNTLNIEHILPNKGVSLSGGERRRVEIARSLAIDPKFLLLDEPFAGIDPLSVIEIQKIIKDLVKSNIGVLITDHNVRETLKVCDQAYIISDGQVIAHGKPSKIVKDKIVQDVYLGDNFKL